MNTQTTKNERTGDKVDELVGRKTMWIDKNDKLPEIGVKVRVWVPQEKKWFEDRLQKLSESDGGGAEFTHWYKHNVSHWMPICETESPLFNFWIKPPNA